MLAGSSYTERHRTSFEGSAELNGGTSLKKKKKKKCLTCLPSNEELLVQGHGIQ